MPNVKLYVDELHYRSVGPGLSALLPELRDMLCTTLSVGHSACQIAVISVLGLPDQPPINAELHVLPRMERTPALLRQMALDLRSHLNKATGLAVAVRIASLDPETYITLK